MESWQILSLFFVLKVSCYFLPLIWMIPALVSRRAFASRGRSKNIFLNSLVEGGLVFFTRFLISAGHSLVVPSAHLSSSSDGHLVAHRRIAGPNT
jgi:hypothetical protein